MGDAGDGDRRGVSSGAGERPPDRRLGVRLRPPASRNPSGHQFQTKARAKKRCGEPQRLRTHPQSRAPETSLRRQEKPSTRRFGCSRGGGATAASMPSQSRTVATSPNGTPVCIMPNGPGFMPTNSSSFGARPQRLR